MALAEWAMAGIDLNRLNLIPEDFIKISFVRKII